MEKVPRMGMELCTDYGRMMAISQIIFGQYHISDIYGLGLISKVFLVSR